MTRIGNKLVIRINKKNIFRFEDVALILFFSGNAMVYLIGRAFSIVGMSSLSYIGIFIAYCITGMGVYLGLINQDRSFLAGNFALLIFLI